VTKKNTKKPAAVVAPAAIIIPPICITGTGPSGADYSVGYGHHHGDQLVFRTANAEFLTSGRRATAEELRRMADAIDSVCGDPISGAQIFVLMRRAR
jgi:hypothetical protein